MLHFVIKTEILPRTAQIVFIAVFLLQFFYCSFSSDSPEVLQVALNSCFVLHFVTKTEILPRTAQIVFIANKEQKVAADN